MQAETPLTLPAWTARGPGPSDSHSSDQRSGTDRHHDFNPTVYLRRLP